MNDGKKTLIAFSVVGLAGYLFSLKSKTEQEDLLPPHLKTSFLNAEFDPYGFSIGRHQYQFQHKKGHPASLLEWTQSTPSIRFVAPWVEGKFVEELAKENPSWVNNLFHSYYTFLLNNPNRERDNPYWGVSFTNKLIMNPMRHFSDSNYKGE